MELKVMENNGTRGLGNQGTLSRDLSKNILYLQERDPRNICLPGFQNCRASATTVCLIFFPVSELRLLIVVIVSPFHIVWCMGLWEQITCLCSLCKLCLTQIMMAKSCTLEPDTGIGCVVLGKEANICEQEGGLWQTVGLLLFFYKRIIYPCHVTSSDYL